MLGLPPGFDLPEYVANHLVLGLGIVSIALVLFSLRLVLSIINKVRSAL